MNTICKIDGCNRTKATAGYCNAHYFRLRRHGDPLSGRMLNGDGFKHVLSLIECATPNECQMWAFRRDKSGYARVTHEGSDKLVHDIVCTTQHGAKPSQFHCVAHSCGKGNLGCVNHYHLRWDTYSGNENDKLQHGTHNRGEQSGMHKLSSAEVKLIRYFCDNDMLSHAQLSRVFKISPGQISRIRNRIDWSWLS